MGRHSAVRPRDERGAAAAMVAVLMSLVLVGIAAIAVDLGVQRTARRDMQAVADLVALDLARQLDGRTSSALTSVMTTEAAKSRARNSGTIGSTPTVTWELGAITRGAFAPVAGTAVPTAVKVTARTRVGFSFGGAVGSSGGDAARTAVAQAAAGACFTVGSYAARVNLGDSFILGPLTKALGTDLNLNLLDLQGLAATNLKLVDLVGTGLTAGGFDDVVNASVTVGQFYLATARALANAGGNAAQVALLNRLATVAIKDTVVRVGDIVGIDTSGPSGLLANANVLDLVSTTAFLANGTNAISIPSLTVNVPGLTSLTASLKVAQKPTMVCGRAGSAQAQASQVDLDLSGNLVNLNLGVGVITAPISVSLRLTPTVAALQKVACLSTTKKLDFLVTNGLLGLEVLVGSTTNLNALSVKVTGITVANGYVRLTTAPKGGDTTAGSISVANENYTGTAPLSTGAGSLGLPALTPDSRLALLPNVPLIGFLVNTLLGGLVNGVVVPLITTVVNPLLTALDAALLSPLLDALGINVAGADVYARPMADCGIPRLVG